jgi:hypothetical protein
MEGEYTNDEVRSLEDIWCLTECMHSVYTFQEVIRGERERGKKNVIFPWKRPRALSSYKISPSPFLNLGGIL